MVGVETGVANVRLGSKPDILSAPRDVRFTPESGHRHQPPECLLIAINGHPTSIALLRQPRLAEPVNPHGYVLGAIEWGFAPNSFNG